MASGASAQDAGPQRPNVIYLFSDEHRWQAMSLSQAPEMKTPNMKRMAELAAGTRFPTPLLKSVYRCQDDPEAVKRVGIHWATEQCRDLIRSISESLDGYSRNLDSMTRTIHRNVSEYVDILRKHIHSENDVFFPMVEEVLTEAEDEALLEEFRKYEAKMGPNVRETYRDLVTEMAKTLEISPGRSPN